MLLDQGFSDSRKKQQRFFHLYIYKKLSAKIRCCFFFASFPHISYQVLIQCLRKYTSCYILPLFFHHDWPGSVSGTKMRYMRQKAMIQSCQHSWSHFYLYLYFYFGWSKCACIHNFWVANGILTNYNIRYGTSVIRFGRLASPKSLGRSLQNHDKLQI